MGNRAVVSTKTADGFCAESIGVYLQWNGGRDSITAFLKYCELQGWKSPEIDSDSWSKFQQIIMNYGLTADRDKCKNLDCDNGDNGVYLIENWQIVGRKFMDHEEQDEYPLKEMLLDIDEKQPAAMQIHDKILMDFATANKTVVAMTGNEETGYRVVKILICDAQRHHSALFCNSDRIRCNDWMEHYAKNNGFDYDEKSKVWIKTA